MQWLIDLVIAAIGIPPVYIDRGDPVAYDFDKTDFTTDGAWHDLDLSAIVPDGASAILFQLAIKDDVVGQSAQFRDASHINSIATTVLALQVANVFNTTSMVVGISPEHHVEYSFNNAVWDNIFFVVCGWWL